LAKHIGDVFEGVVTGVTNFGMFVQHPRYLIDGLLRFEDLGDDWWDVDLRLARVVGERSRQTFTMGSLVAVQIAGVDLAARQLNLSLAADARRRSPTKAGRTKRPRKGPAKKVSIRKSRAHGVRRGPRGRRR
jgi:ribonuclease R